MSIVDGDVLSLVTEFDLTGAGVLQNRFTWKWQGGEHPEAGVVAALTSWAEDFFELAAEWCPADIDSFNVYVDQLEYDEETEKWVVSANVGATTGSVTFTGGSELLPLQCAPCLVGFTAKPKSRGRKFLPLWLEPAQIAGVFVEAAQDELADMLAEYLATHIVETGKSLAPGVVSDKWGVFLPFVSGLVKALVFTQRRRRRGVGA
jgi:hypothetical protein